MPKLAPPPSVTPETWRVLISLTADFAALAPWKYAVDVDVVGLIDPVTGATRIGTVLGNAGEVFAAVIYRRAGLRWILSMRDEAPEHIEDLNNVEGMDCLKVELAPKRELRKEDLALLKAAAFTPKGKGAVWPQFRSAEPGWHPWHINQTEAGQLVADLPRLTAFYRMFEAHPELYDGRAPAEIPFLPVVLPDRPLTPDDLDWHPFLSPPDTGPDPYQPTTEVLEKLRALTCLPDFTCEYDCSLLPGGSFMENGRPCFGRVCILVEKREGMVVGMSMQSGALTAAEGAGRGLVESLLKAGSLPEVIMIRGSRLQPALQPLCDALEIQLSPVSSLPNLERALAFLSRHMAGANR